jgi:hypothetical protein
MQLHADLVFACRIVGLGNVERVEVLACLAAMAPRNDAAGYVARVDTASPEATERIIEPDSARDDLGGLPLSATQAPAPAVDAAFSIFFHAGTAREAAAASSDGRFVVMPLLATAPVPFTARMRTRLRCSIR